MSNDNSKNFTNDYLKMSDFEGDYYKENKEIFDFGSRISKNIYEVFSEAYIRRDNIDMFLISIFREIHQLLQSAMILSARGMEAQPEILCRTLLERVFMMVAVEKDHDLYAKWIEKQKDEKRKLRNKIRNKEPGFENMTIPVEEEKTAYRGLSYKEWAKRADMEAEYNMLYSYCSNAVHYSETSFNRNYDVEGENVVLKLFLETDEVGTALFVCIKEAMEAWKTVVKHFDLDDKTIRACFEEFKEMEKSQIA